MEQTTIKKDNTGEKIIKFTFDGSGKEDAVETLNKFCKDCNNKNYGKKVTVSDVIARGLRKLDMKDLKLLQEQSMGLKDSLKQKYVEDKGSEGTEDEFVSWLLNEYPHRKKK